VSAHGRKAQGDGPDVKIVNGAHALDLADLPGYVLEAQIRGRPLRRM
jgi:hypothetical protein